VGGRGGRAVPDDAGTGGGGEASVTSFDGEGGGREEVGSCADFLGAAAAPPEKKDAIDLCMWRRGGGLRRRKERNVVERGGATIVGDRGDVLAFKKARLCVVASSTKQGKQQASNSSREQAARARIFISNRPLQQLQSQQDIGSKSIKGCFSSCSHTRTHAEQV